MREFRLTWHVALVLVALVVSRAAQGESFDLKGLSLNDTETAAAKRHPSLKCRSSEDGGHFCTGASTFAEIPARLSYKTFDGKVVAVMIQLDRHSFDVVAEALLDKFGEPTHRSGSHYMWIQGAEELTAIEHDRTFSGESSLLLRETGDTPYSRALKKEKNRLRQDM